MANTNNPHGFRPLYTMSGGPILTDILSKIAGYGTAIFLFDLVNRVADGSIEAGSATPYSGVALNYGATLTATDHTVIIGPDQVYEAQADAGGGANILAADLGLNCSGLIAAGSATTKLSGHQLDSSTKAVTATLDFHLMKHLQVPDNDATAAYARVEVCWSQQRMQAGVVGV